MHEDKTPEGVSRFENMEELLNAIREFTGSPRTNPETGEIEENVVRTLDEFLQDVALLTDADYGDKEGTDRVVLMTVHSAKGLEFPYVFVTGLEENLFPSIQSLNSRADLEEERRLFYVAVTRAQKKLTLAYAENRYRWGNLTMCEPSRFISEVPEKLIDFPKRVSAKKESFLSSDNFSNMLPGLNLPPKKFNFQKQPGSRPQPNPKAQGPGTPIPPVNPDLAGIPPANVEEIQTGMEVEHERFGKGKVVGVEGIGPNKKATVFFPAIGQKQLLLRFARLRIVQ
jgi:DNA helicase-2/ATP-dependent DNA helicase PcrA